MSIEHLPYLSKTDKELYRVYKKNNDSIGLRMLVITFQSKLLNHIINNLENIIKRKNYNCYYTDSLTDTLAELETIVKGLKENLKLI